MAITPLPALARTSPTFKTDTDTFFGSQLPTFSTQAEAARVEIDANKIQTGLDKVATAADRVQTGLDRVSTTASATTATTQAGNASSSATAALGSQNAASGSATAALASLNDFKGRWYGALAADPTLDPLGAAVTVGDAYFNSASNLLKIYNGATWQTSDINMASLAASGGAGLVGFTKPGPVQTVQQQLDMMYYGIANVTDTQYAGGAKLNGVADDTIAILSAIASGKNVYIPPGNAKITSKLTNPHPTKITGAGMGQTTITVVGSSYNAIELVGDYSGVEGIYFNSPTYRSSGATIAITNATRGNTVKFCKFQHQSNPIGITANAVITWISDCEAVNTTPTTGVVIDIGGGNDTMIERFICDNNPADQPLAGLRVQKSDAIWATDCDFIHCGHGLAVAPDSGRYITWLFLNNCAFDSGSGYGVLVSPTGTGSVRGLFFNGCWSSTNDSGGVLIQKGADAVVDGVFLDQHKSLNNQRRGILVTGGDNVHISDPVISGNSGAAPGTYAGIDMQSGVSNWSIKGGKSGAALGFANSQAYGILVNPGSSDNYSIRGVDVAGNVTAGIFDGGAGGNKSVAENNGFKTLARGVAIVAPGATEATIAHGLALIPSSVLATPSNYAPGEGARYWVGSFTATTFTINISTAAPTNATFAWQACV